MTIRSAFALTLAAGLVCVGPVVGQSHDGHNHGPTPKTQQPQPQRQLPERSEATSEQDYLEFNEFGIDFGEIDDQNVVEHNFEFTNTSDKAVRISARGSCGCTVPKLEKDVYQPGETGQIQVRFSPLGRNGPQHKTVAVTISDAQTNEQLGRQRLDVQSQVTPLVQFAPVRTFFQQVPHGSGAEQQVTVTSRMPGFEVTGFSCDNEHVDVELGQIERTTNAQGEEVSNQHVTISISPEAPIGRIDTQVMLHTNDERIPQARHVMSAMVVGSLQAQPNLFFVRQPSSEAPFSSVVRLMSRDGEPFHITSVDVIDAPVGTHAVVDFEPAEAGNPNMTGYMLRLSGVTPSVAGVHSGSVIVKTDAGENEEIRIDFRTQVARRMPNAAPIRR